MEHRFNCPYCGEEISMVLDLSVDRQTHIEGWIPYGQETDPGRCPEPELIALRTLMINQAREGFCQGEFPASLIYVLTVEPVARCAGDFYAASLS